MRLAGLSPLLSGPAMLMGTQIETGGAHMKQLIQAVCLAAFLPCAAALAQAPEYTADNRLVLPADDREWILLTSRLDLNFYQAVPSAVQRWLLQNVFDNPPLQSLVPTTGT